MIINFKIEKESSKKKRFSDSYFTFVLYKTEYSTFGKRSKYLFWRAPQYFDEISKIKDIFAQT